MALNNKSANSAFSFYNIETIKSIAGTDEIKDAIEFGKLRDKRAISDDTNGTMEVSI